MMDGETSGLAAAEEACARQEPLVDVLRLLCLNCVMSGGLKTRDFDRVRRDLLQTYGYDLLLTLVSLFVCTHVPLTFRASPAHNLTRSL